MGAPDDYAPGAAAADAAVEKRGETWALVLVRVLAHPPARVWAALTEPEHLRAWAPFDADRSLGAVGSVRLSTVGTPTPQVTETRVKRADAPRTLELTWGGGDLRWELEPLADGRTRLTLWHGIHRKYIAMGAAGWHIALDVLERALAGRPVGRIAGLEAMRFDGWRRLVGEYAARFGVASPLAPPETAPDPAPGAAKR